MSIVDLITVQKLSADVRRRAKSGEIVYLYDDTKPGWKGSAPFYVFACINEDCVNHERLAIDYAHGFKNHNERVTCLECQTSKYFPIAPMSLWEKIKLILAMKKIFKDRKEAMLERKR